MTSSTMFCYKFFIIFLLINIYSSTSDIQQRDAPKYLLLSPSRLIAGSVNRICLSRLGQATQGSATGQLEVLTYWRSTPTNNRTTRNGESRVSRHPHKYIARARKMFPSGNGGCFDLLVSRTPHRKAILQFRMRFDALPGYKVWQRREVSVQHDSTIAVIQTDKALYRAGETVKIRILQLRPDLTPLMIPVHRVSIETPPDKFAGPVKVVQWFNMTTQMGLTQREYQLDKYAQQGTWRIVVDSRDPWVGSTVQTFLVTDYTLPAFHITVQHDKTVLVTFKQIVWNICARYIYGEGVNGKLDITVSSDSYNSQKVHFVTELKNSIGCYNYTVRTQPLGFGQSKDVPTVVIADIAFQEYGTRTWKNATAVSNVSKQVVKVHYVSRHNKNFKPGLPYKVKVRVTDWGHRSVINAKVQFCRIIGVQSEEIDNMQEAEVLYDTRNIVIVAGEGSNSSADYLRAKNLIDECETAITDIKGYVSFTFTVGMDQNIDYLTLKVLVLQHPFTDLESPSDEKRFAAASMVLRSWDDPVLTAMTHGGAYMEIGYPLAGNTELRPGSRHTFPVFLTMRHQERVEPITLHYTLITRSGTLFRWGTLVQCPRLARDVQNIQIVSVPDLEPGPTECLRTDERYARGSVYRMMLSVKISHHMCPFTTLLVYFVSHDNELVVASKNFRVSECFYNKVHLQWIPDTVAPSSNARLQLRSPGPALCLTSATSSALQSPFSQPPQVHRQVTARLMSFVEARINRTKELTASDICFKEKAGDALDNSSVKVLENTIKTFLNSGMEILSDVVPHRAECPQESSEQTQMPAELVSQENHPKERSFFPETWLWNIHLMDSRGVLDVSATTPDTITQWDSEVYCLSRSGIAVPSVQESGVLKVMQPFFVELVTPKVIKRSEEAHMHYKIFNYMDQDIPVSLELDISPSAAATITSHSLGQLINRVACVRRGSSLVNHFTLKGHQLRSINVTVAVQVVNNMNHYCNSNVTTEYDIRDKVLKTVSVEPEGYPIENHKSALLCVNDHSNHSELSWNMERVECVDQSENWMVSIVGDITGPMPLNLDSLISIPMGCGEQNMALLAYNIQAMEYAMAGKRLPSDVKEKTLQHFSIGYQRQLRFRHASGAFSAFGPQDPSPSTWLTAFCARHIRLLSTHWEGAGSQGVVTSAVSWLLEQQMENGCFRNIGQVFHREMKGGLRSGISNIALTAYVVISLIDSNIPDLKVSVIQNAAFCLAALKYNHHQGNTRSASDQDPDNMYAFTLATLAQIKIEKFLKAVADNKNEVYEQKRNLVKREISVEYDDHDSQEGDFNQFIDTFDLDNEYENVSRDYETDNVLTVPLFNIFNKDEESEDKNRKENAFLAGGGANALNILKTFAQRSGDMIWWEAGSLSVSIETTAYAMLSLLESGGDDNILEAMSAARWMSLHRNSHGGFISTQDTLVGLQALGALRRAMPGTSMVPSLSVIVRAPGRGRHFSVSPAERHKLHTVVLRAVDSRRSPSHLSVHIQGKGCLLVQATQRYNRLSKPSAESPFMLFAKVTTDGTFDCKDNGTLCMCAAVLEVCVSWSAPSGIEFPEMALLEVQLPTGYSTDRSLLNRLINPQNSLLRRIEESPNEDTVYLYLALRDRESSVNPGECIRLYLVGPMANTLPATVRVYDYYHTEVFQIASYTIPESCDFDRDRKPHDEPMDMMTQQKTPEERRDTVNLFPPSVSATTVDGDQFINNWHVIDTDYDLETPKTNEGVPPVFALPPPTFNTSIYV